MKTKLIIYKGCDNFIKILVNFVLNKVVNYNLIFNFDLKIKKHHQLLLVQMKYLLFY